MNSLVVLFFVALVASTQASVWGGWGWAGHGGALVGPANPGAVLQGPSASGGAIGPDGSHTGGAGHGGVVVAPAIPGGVVSGHVSPGVVAVGHGGHGWWGW